MIIPSSQYPSKEQLELDVQAYREALIAHAQTEGVPAPWPPNSLVEHIVRNDLQWTWEQLPEPTQAIVVEDPPVGPTEKQTEGFEFVADLYNDYLAQRVYYDGLEEYQQLRSKAYPSIGDQLDALFKAGVFPENMAAQIQAVKDMYPKPSDIAFTIGDE